MQLVILDFFYLHWLESTKPHVQRDLGNPNSSRSDLFKNLSGKVQASRRSGH